MTAADALAGRVLVPGAARGRLLRLATPISFWGGVDPATGRISDPRHPDHGREIGGRVLALAATIGSSSSSAIMLELMRTGRAPAALLLGRADAILTLGVIVGRELGYGAIPVLEVAAEALARLPDSAQLRVTAQESPGRVEVEGEAP